MCFLFFKQKTAYEVRISDWSSDVCSSDLATADMVAKQIDEARKGQKAAEDLHKEEAKPFDDGKKAVQAKWTPITDEKKSKYALIIATAKIGRASCRERVCQYV